MERKSFESWWLYISEETAIKNIISCTEITELKTLSKFLYELKWKWKKKQVEKKVQIL